MDQFTSEQELDEMALTKRKGKEEHEFKNLNKAWCATCYLFCDICGSRAGMHQDEGDGPEQLLLRHRQLDPARRPLLMIASMDAYATRV